MPAYQLQNLKRGVLASGGMDSSQTTVPLASGYGVKFPSTASSAGSFFVNIWDGRYASAQEALDAGFAEIVKCTSHDHVADTIATVSRGQGGTSAIAHNTAGITYYVDLVLTKEVYDDLVTGAKCQVIPSAYQSLWGSLVLGSGYTNLGVYVCPVNLVRQDAKYISFHCSTAFPAGDKGCVGLYDWNKNLVLDGGFQGLDVTATNLMTTLSSISNLQGGQHYLAWSVKKTTNIKALWGITFDTGNAGIVNMGGSLINMGLAANAASDAAIGSQGLPATLGAISAVNFTIGFPVVVIGSD